VIRAENEEDPGEIDAAGGFNSSTIMPTYGAGSAEPADELVFGRRHESLDLRFSEQDV
jgi:hypothetical protein